MTFRDIQWIFFDVGQTLLDENAAWQDLFERLTAEVRKDGIQTSPEALRRVYREVCVRFEPKQWKAIVQSVTRSPERMEELVKLSECYRHDLERPFEGAGEVLRTLSRRYKLGVIANQFRGTHARLCGHGWGDYIALCVSSAEAGVSKPDLRIFEVALRDAGCRPEHAVMVGDRLDNDIRPGKAIGMRTVHVRQGGSGAQRPRDDADRPDATIDRIADLPALFDA
jgi:HAD superfamily hydrolase (TIGR01509 family)